MQIEDLLIILKVAEFRSITAAATSLDMRTATASAAIKRVEASLGAELFIRTTRSLKISAAGERFLPQCEEALKMLEKAKMNLQEDLGIIDGTIRIALSSDLGRNIVAPWLDEFLLQYPNVSLSAHISDSNVDFYRDSVDMALRYGAPTDASMYGFKICDVPRVLCASPEYLNENGTPTTPDELLNHNALCYQLHDILQNEWVFSEEKRSHKVKLTSNRGSNDGDLVRRWCVSGKGIAIKSSLDMSQDLLAGKVVAIMPTYKPTPTELWLVLPSRQSITPTVRLLRDMLRDKTKQTLEKLNSTGIVEC
ncbi:LysR family transcriptional regulator [Vibrio marisflavi]|uniref:HTH-type transcriptional regulator DmlR n=1 Tax=Vibrio marisflavi CECT 7928 TaxID=634439 RepID=A0ABN8E4B3_9VIBR|nr:LysR family transcriptional regulator [Vibrio marisflavi]CAH0540302.1 HTH-type transcriptional regulator DmlR [Vibrio marisflavi CECT 7928]